MKLLLCPTSKSFYDLFQWNHNPFMDRPYVNGIIRVDTFFRYLKDDIHQWLLDNNIDYSLSYYVYVGPYNPLLVEYYLNNLTTEQEVLFKLTWL